MPSDSVVDPDYLLYLSRGVQLPDQDDDDETGDDDYEEDDEEEESYEDGHSPEIVPLHGSPRVSQSGPLVTSQARTVSEAEIVVIDEDSDNSRITPAGNACSSKGSSQGTDWNRHEIDGLFCPICMEAWSNDGDHHICCLPCGHIYGMSCIIKWLRQFRSSGKCPQCNKKCTLKDVRKLYASQIAVIDEESQKRIQSLEAKCVLLEKKDANWFNKERAWKKRETTLSMEILQLKERTTYLEHLLGDKETRQSGFLAAGGGCGVQSVSGLNSNFCSRGASYKFLLKKDLRVDGARLFDIDAYSQIVIIARRQLGMGGMHVLTKMSLLSPHEKDDIILPPSTKSVRDLHISPSNSSLALLCSLGKKLSIFSMESNNVVLNYDLSAPAWSCSWDLNSPHYAYAGLQNGSLLVFDIRQTAGPVESLEGLSSNPVHTVHSLLSDSTHPPGTRNVLTASSIGLCQWKFGGVEERPFIIPETGNQGVCISVAYCPSSNIIVSSCRPRVHMYNEVNFSQLSPTPSSGVGKGVRGSHVQFKGVSSGLYQKMGSSCTNVNDVRLPKTAIIDIDNQKQLFASEDEVACRMVVQELPSFEVVEGLRSPKRPIYDVKYTNVIAQSLLGCLSDDALQLFRVECL